MEDISPTTTTGMWTKMMDDIDPSKINALSEGWQNSPREPPEFRWPDARASPLPTNYLSLRRPSLDSAVGSAIMDTPLHSPDMGRSSFYSPDFRHYSGRFGADSPLVGHHYYYADSGFDSSEYQASPFMGHDYPEDTFDDCGLVGKMFPDLPNDVPAYSPPSREVSDSQESTFAIISASAPPQLVSVPSYTPTCQLSREGREIIRSDIINPMLRNTGLQSSPIQSILLSVNSQIDSGEIATLRDLENYIIKTPKKDHFTAKEYVLLATEFIKSCRKVFGRLTMLDQSKPDEPTYESGHLLNTFQTLRLRLVEVYGFTQQEVDSLPQGGDEKHEESSRVTTGGITCKTEPASPPLTPPDRQRHSIPDNTALGLQWGALTVSVSPPHNTSKEIIPQQQHSLSSNPVGQAIQWNNMPSPTTRLVDMIPDSRLEVSVQPMNSRGDHQCHQCTKTFTRQCDLRKHLKTHERPHKCPDVECRFHIKGFSAEKDRDRHWHDLHDPNAKKIKCDWADCSYTSTRESNVKQHMEKTHEYVYVRTKQVQKRAKPSTPPKKTRPQSTKRKSLDAASEPRKRRQLSSPATPLSPPLDVSSSSSPNTLNHSPVQQSFMFPPLPQQSPVAQSISPAIIQGQMQNYFDNKLAPTFTQPRDAVRAITHEVHTPGSAPGAPPSSSQNEPFKYGNVTLGDDYHGSSDEEFHRTFSNAPAKVTGMAGDLPSLTQSYPIVKEPFNEKLDASLQ